MSNLDIEGTVLDSFNIAFRHDNWAIDPKHISMRIEEELHERLHVCNKLNKTYAVYVVIAELEGDRDAIGQRKEGEDAQGFW